jgi:HlyD family secretion protein
MKLATILVLVLVAAAAGGWFWHAERSAAGEMKYRMAKIERGAIAEVILASGTLNAVTSAQVLSPISGQIKEIYADFNTPVKRGQVIARIDPASFELRVNQARADLEAAESAVALARSGYTAREGELGRLKGALTDAQRDFERKKTLADKNFISRAELEKDRGALEAAREQLKLVEAQLEASQAQVQRAAAAVKQRESLLRQAESELERTTIRSPVDGTVVLRNVEVGQTVSVSKQAPVLFAIAQDLREMQVQVAIDEAEAARLRPGMAASFTVEAAPRRNFAGEVREIRKSAQNGQQAPSHTALIAAPNADLALLPGMTANVRIVVEERQAALKVPNAALRFRPGAAPQEDAGSLLEELRPNEVQKAQLDEILREARERMARAREIRTEAERKREMDRVRAETDAKIGDILTSEQKPAWDRLLAEARTHARPATGRLWLLRDGVPTPPDVRLGISDGKSTELVGGELAEGSEVIVGVAERRRPSQARGNPVEVLAFK